MKIRGLLFLLLSPLVHAQVTIKVDPASGFKKISPYIYGRNNSFSSTNPNWTLSSGEYTQIHDAGVTFFRESGGNNCTKYNWQKKLSSHPDWYNNVYAHDWDETAKTIQKNFPQAQGMWAFQLLGKAAKTNQANFNDWGYNQSNWWPGVSQNLAGNGILNPTGTKAIKDGDINIYLQDWPADSTTGIINHWFGTNGIGLNKSQVKYWNMDNEPEIWNGTHDDVVPKQIPAEDFMQRYFAVAKQARKLYPDIKLVGPVTANEWQWYNWDGPVSYKGRNVPWIEYFILRCAEEQKSSGIRLLDIVDLHFYPYTNKTEDIVQLHRVFFDENYIFPEANGVKNVNGSWDNSQNKEYIFTRINQWLATYFGSGHNIKLGVTELGFNNQNANTTAVTYASMLGEFMNHEVEIFTPWSWENGMWEILHLFTKYNQSYAIQSTSSNETLASAYSSMNATKDSLTIVLVNRSINAPQQVAVDISGFIPSSNKATRNALYNLPNTETFISDTKNALHTNEVSITNHSLNLSLEPLSVSSISLAGRLDGAVPIRNDYLDQQVSIYPNPTTGSLQLDLHDQKLQEMDLIDLGGKVIQSFFIKNSDIQLPAGLMPGVYILRMKLNAGVVNKRLLLIQ